MTQRISNTAFQNAKSFHTIFKFFYLNIRILKVVALGHGGTRK